VRGSTAILMKLNGSLTAWRDALPWRRGSQRRADTVGNMLDFRRVVGAGPRIMSTVVCHHAIRNPETFHASGRPSR